MMDQVRNNWEMVAFILGVVFVLGGYAVMISVLRDNVKILFRLMTQKDERLNVLESERAVLSTQVANLEKLMDETKGIALSIASEIRTGGHVRRSDKG